MQLDKFHRLKIHCIQKMQFDEDRYDTLDDFIETYGSTWHLRVFSA